jgi:conjugative transfer signal peptidase TraF
MLWGCGAACVAAISVLASLLWPPRPLLLWNASPSSPIGLYALSSAAAPRTGDMAVAWAPPAARRLAAARRYLPFQVPLVKPVAAAAGDRVCALRNRIIVNGKAVALRRAHDPSGRPMPWWTGCARLGRGETFLLSAGGPLAFDGRYFGSTRASELVGKARLLWARPIEGSGRD